MLVLQIPVNFQPTVTLDSLLLVAATALLAICTYLLYKATREGTRSQLRPRVIAWPREEAKGPGIYVQSVGLGPAYNGNIICTTSVKGVVYGTVSYGFTRMFISQTYEYPIEGQPPIPFKVALGVGKLSIDMSYEDINGHKYKDHVEFDMDKPPKLGQV